MAYVRTFSIKAQNKLITWSSTCKNFYNSATVPSYLYNGIVATCLNFLFLFLSLCQPLLLPFLYFFFLWFSLLLHFSLPCSRLSLVQACHQSWVGFGVVMAWWSRRSPGVAEIEVGTAWRRSKWSGHDRFRWFVWFFAINFCLLGLDGLDFGFLWVGILDSNGV